MANYECITIQNCPTTQAIGKIVKKFEEITRVLAHHRFARSAENIPIVSESVAKDPNLSSFSAIRTVLRHDTLWRILHFFFFFVCW